MRAVALMTLAVVSALWVGAAQAAVVVVVDKSGQRMSVAIDGAPRYQWAVSTGRPGYGTPSGVYHPEHLARTWFSRKYYNSPMPHAIFFHGGFAIHGSYEISRLGGPASHGCIRLHPSHAAQLFALVESHGPAHTKIIVTGASPTVHRAYDGFGGPSWRANPSTPPGFGRSFWFDGRS